MEQSKTITEQPQQQQKGNTFLGSFKKSSPLPSQQQNQNQNMLGTVTDKTRVIFQSKLCHCYNIELFKEEFNLCGGIGY